MAANIQTFASLRTPAWHGMGTIIESPVSSFEFQGIAGLNWGVSDSPVYTAGMVEVPGVKAIVRDDNQYPLGIVGRDYQSIQNADLFAFLKDLGEFDTELVVETAGALGSGETVWAMARMEGLRLALGNDIVDPYILLANGHIGNRKMIVLPTSIRVVCQNTLRMAIGAAKGKNGLSAGWAIRHTTNAMDRLQEARKSLQEVATEWTATKEAISRMADKKASDDFILDLINATFGDKKEGASKRGDTLAENRNKAIFANLESGTSKGLDTEGSIWSALNALTEWLDHEAIVRVQDRDDDRTEEEKKADTATNRAKAIAKEQTIKERRFENNLIDGPSLKYKEKAFEYAYSMVV